MTDSNLKTLWKYFSENHDKFLNWLNHEIMQTII